MPDIPSSLDPGERPPLQEKTGPRSFPSLRESLSMNRPSLNRNRSSPIVGHDEGGSRYMDPDSESKLAALPPPELAFVALQYLPIPVLILSSSKLVMLGNDAFRKLLTRNHAAECYCAWNDGNSIGLAGGGTFTGLSLHQMGIFLVQEDHRTWTDWEVPLCCPCPR